MPWGHRWGLNMIFAIRKQAHSKKLTQLPANILIYRWCKDIGVAGRSHRRTASPVDISKSGMGRRPQRRPIDREHCIGPLDVNTAGSGLIDDMTGDCSNGRDEDEGGRFAPRMMDLWVVKRCQMVSICLGGDRRKWKEREVWHCEAWKLPWTPVHSHLGSSKG